MKGHFKISPVSNFVLQEEWRWMGFALAFVHSPDVESILRQNAARDSWAVPGPLCGLGFGN